jgi:hypothetical protein
VSDRFVLDQSVVYGALCGRPKPAEAIRTIVARCDTIIWNGEWWAKCYQTIQQHGWTSAGLRLLRVLNQALVWRGKMHQATADAPALPDEAGIHHKDLWLVRLAVSESACVVAEDAPLLEALRQKGIRCAAPADVRGT